MIRGSQISSSILLVVGLLLSGCSEDAYDSVVPEYEVKYSCNSTLVNAYLQQTDQISLDCQGGYVRVYDKKNLSAGDVVGVAGLLILQNYEGSFYAFDLACPHCFSTEHGAAKVSRLNMKEDGFTAYCPSCNSEFNAVFWGSPAPTAGPANTEKLVLRQYRAQRLMDGVTVVVSR